MTKAIRLACISFFILLVISCKSKKLAIDGSIDKDMSARAIIRTHYQNQMNFKTLRGRMKIEYFDGESSKSVTVSLRMQKDKAIWISAPLGIIKAYVTPNRVTFYNKLQNEYFDGDFSYLSNMLGIELNFEKVQNLLLGQALFDLRDAKYDVMITGSDYVLKPKKPLALFKTLYRIDPHNFKISTQQLSQPLRKRVLDIEYKEYQQINEKVLPNEVVITAIEANTKNEISLDYRSIEFNRALRFPYKIPKGFKKIVLDTNAL